MCVKLLIPAYKPDENLLILTEQLIPFGGILIVNDGSGPEYASLFQKAQQLGATVLHHENNCGKGAALKTGIRYVGEHEPGTSLVTADADGQHSPKDILRVAEMMKASPETLVLGVRDIKKMPLRSCLGNSITRFFFRLVTKLDISDTQTGLRGLPYLLFERLLSVQGNRYEYEMNMLLSLGKWGVPFAEIPIETIYIDENERTHFHALRDGIRVFSRVLKYCVSSVTCAALDFGLYALFLLWFPTVYAYILARIVSSIANYQFNRCVVFRAKGSIRSAVGYFLLALCVLVAGSLSVGYLAQIGLDKVLAKVLVDSFLFVCNYLLQKKVVFKKERKKDRE